MHEHVKEETGGGSELEENLFQQRFQTSIDFSILYMNTGIGRHMANSSRVHFPIIKFSNLIIIISY